MTPLQAVLLIVGIPALLLLLWFRAVHRWRRFSTQERKKRPKWTFLFRRHGWRR